jgi:serine/threonine protein kinase
MGHALSLCAGPTSLASVAPTPTSALAGAAGAAGAAAAASSAAAAALNGASTSASAESSSALAALPLTQPAAAFYELGRALGRGSFGTCVQARDLRTGEEVAIKTLDLSRVRASSVAREHAVLSHIAAAAQLLHAAESPAGAAPPPPLAFNVPGLVSFRGALRTEAPRAEVCFVFELMRGGELFALLIRRGALPEPLVRRSLRPVAEALAFLHASGVVHRDIKPENLLLSEAVPDSTPLHEVGDLKLKISDMGLAQLLDARGGTRLLKTCGTWAYSAPEMHAPARPGYAFAFDCWSLGVVIYIALSGAHPFDPTGTFEAAEIKARIQRGDFSFAAPVWARVSPLAIDMVRRLLRVEQESRLSAAACLRHGWWTSSHAAALRAPSSSSSPTASPTGAPALSPGRGKLKAAAAATIAVSRFAASASRPTAR